MGNHEFCTECGESDFHWGRPCNEKKRKEQQDRRQSAKNNRIKRHERTLELLRALRSTLENEKDKNLINDALRTLKNRHREINRLCGY